MVTGSSTGVRRLGALLICTGVLLISANGSHSRNLLLADVSIVVSPSSSMSASLLSSADLRAASFSGAHHLSITGVLSGCTNFPGTKGAASLFQAGDVVCGWGGGGLNVANLGSILCSGGGALAGILGLLEPPFSQWLSVCANTGDLEIWFNW